MGCALGGVAAVLFQAFLQSLYLARRKLLLLLLRATITTQQGGFHLQREQVCLAQKGILGIPGEPQFQQNRPLLNKPNRNLSQRCSISLIQIERSKETSLRC
jgi:hypothetical protein